MPRGDERAADALSWVTFLISFPFGVLLFLLPVYGRELGATALGVGWLFALIAVVPVLIRPFLGPLLDRLGRRPFLLLGLGAFPASLVLFAVARSQLLLAAGSLCYGLGHALFWLAARTMVADLAASQSRGRRFGSLDAALGRGELAGAATGILFVLLLAPGGPIGPVWRPLLATYLVPSLIGCGIALRRVPETRPARDPTLRSGLGLSRAIGAMMALVFLSAASSAGIWPLVMYFLQEQLGSSIPSLALAYLPTALVLALLPGYAGRLADRFGRKVPMVVGLLASAAASWLLPGLSSLVVLAVVWALETAGNAVAVPAQNAFVADVAGADLRGTSFSLVTFAHYLGATLGPLAGGWVYSRWGRALPFRLNTGVLACCALFVVLGLRSDAPSRSALVE